MSVSLSANLMRVRRLPEVDPGGLGWFQALPRECEHVDQPAGAAGDALGLQEGVDLSVDCGAGTWRWAALMDQIC